VCGFKKPVGPDPEKQLPKVEPEKEKPDEVAVIEEKRGPVEKLPGVFPIPKEIKNLGKEKGLVKKPEVPEVDTEAQDKKIEEAMNLAKEAKRTGLAAKEEAAKAKQTALEALNAANNALPRGYALLMAILALIAVGLFMVGNIYFAILTITAVIIACIGAVVYWLYPKVMGINKQ